MGSMIGQGPIDPWLSDTFVRPRLTGLSLPEGG
jgi:hypothetical protein